MRNNAHDRRLLVMAPVGQDARAIAELLSSRGLPVRICNDGLECSAEINNGAGALLMTEEALETERGLDVLEALKLQPAWSELPVIILTTGGDTRLIRLLELATKAAGTVTLLERPVSSITLLRSIEVALNSRERQFQVRDLLDQQRLDQAELREAHERLADRARELENLVRLRTAKLLESNEQLRSEITERERAEAAREALRRQLIHAQEEERRRIARELHDQMGQNLTALNLGLNRLADSDHSAAKEVKPLQTLAAQTARDLHRVAMELRPAPLDDLGLIKAVRHLAVGWAEHCHIETDLALDAYDSEGVSSEIETTVYRIVQEALNNVAKHSGATRVSIVLRRASDQVQAIIEDNGRGFDSARASERTNGRGRLGLVGMRERIAALNGALHLESTPNHGTTLIVRIPIIKSA